MHRKADAAHEGEDDETRLKNAARQLGEQKPQEFQTDLHVEFAFAFLPRAEKRSATSAMRRPFAAMAMSSRILNPTGDSRGTISSKTSRRIMKNPLIGSLSDVPRAFCVRRVAMRLMAPGPPLNEEALPPST